MKLQMQTAEYSLISRVNESPTACTVDNLGSKLAEKLYAKFLKVSQSQAVKCHSDFFVHIPPYRQPDPIT